VSAFVTRCLRRRLPSRFSPLALLAFVSACSGVSPSERFPRATAHPSVSASIPNTALPAASASAVSSPPVEVVHGRTILGAPVATNLPSSVEPLSADRAVLVVSHGADEREGFVRWIDEAGHVGPVIRFVDEYVVTAFARADGKREFVTSDGERLCIARFASDRADSETRACKTIDANAVAVKDRKLAVISLEEHRVKVEKPQVFVPVRKVKPTPKKSAPKSPAKKKTTSTKKNPPTAKKKNQNKKPKVEKKVEIIRRDVEVLASWATSDGFGEVKKTGLKFVPPLDGMTIVDAKATARGILVAWFEKGKPSPNAPKIASKLPPALGWAAIQSGVLAEDGSFDPLSKKLVVEGEYDWGYVRGFSGPRFVEMTGGVALLTQTAPRGGPCGMTKVGETSTFVLPTAMCTIDPGAWPSVDTKPMETILQAGPKRRPGQPKHDPQLVAWAGDTAYFVTNDGRTLQSAKRDGSVKEEPPPFLMRRVRMTYTELHEDGSGIAIVDGQTYRLNAAGDVVVDEKPGKWKPMAQSVDSENRWKVRLPGGGTWRIDPDRTHVVWMDAAGRETASVPWPEGQSNAVCRDGLPGKKFVPAIVPGQFVEVPALGAPGICVVGQPSWAADGSLRWFGTYAQGFDVLPEIRIVRDLGKPISTSAGPTDERTNKTKSPCPPEMVLVDGKLCVDRFEATIVDVESGWTLSPDFPVTPNLFEIAISDWATGRSRVGSVFARSMPLPFLPEWQRGKKIDVRAESLAHVRPNGYLTGLIAESACTAAGKRLCTLNEFVLACRGEDDRQFPYGDSYIDNVCNVNRDVHPAAMLHDNASIGHLDPRLNRVSVGGATLLRPTGDAPSCRSRWGQDAIYDMVGNLDEWINEEGGAFAGGFYARSTRAGCDAVITAHPKNYLDYSTGVRCCQDVSK
jgi:hypothetical protein